MAASKATSVAVLRKILKYLSLEKTYLLLDELLEVKGNQSFKDTIKKPHDLVHKHQPKV